MPSHKHHRTAGAVARRCARPGRSIRDGARLLGWPEALAVAVILGALVGIVAAAHASGAAADAETLQAAVNGWGAAAAARAELLLAPIPGFMRTLARSLSYVPGRVTPATWADLTAPLVAALPFVSAFALLDEVAGGNRAAWEAAASAEYGRRVQMLRFTANDTVMPAAAEYFVVAAVVGPSAGVLVPGRDAFDDPPRAAAILEALGADDVVVTRGATLITTGAPAYVLFMPVRWPAINRTCLLALTLDGAAALRASVDGVATGTGMALSIGNVSPPDGAVVPVFTDGGALGALDGVHPFSTSFKFVDASLRVLLGPSAAAVAALRAARLASTLRWGAPVVVGVGLASAALMALRLLAQAAATRDALAASDATRDSVMAFFFHELRNPLHAAMGLMAALREDADAAAATAARGSSGDLVHLAIPSNGSRGRAGSRFTNTSEGKSAVEGTGGGFSEVERQLVRMRAVMDGLLDLTMITHGDLAVTFDDVDIPALLRDIAQVCALASLVCAGSTRRLMAPGPLRAAPQDVSSARRQHHRIRGDVGTRAHNDLRRCSHRAGAPPRRELCAQGSTRTQPGFHHARLNIQRETARVQLLLGFDLI